MKKFIIAVSFLMLLSNHVFAADQWAKGEPAASRNPSDISTLIGVNNEAIDRLLKNYISTVRINFNSASQLTVTAGEIVCSNTAGTIRRFRSNPSSTTVTWANIDTGSEENSKTYYVYAVADTDAETFTCKITLSALYPSGATYYKRIGSFYNDASGNIININNDADVHEWGAWVDKSSSYGAQQATTDGEVAVYLSITDVGASKYYVLGYTDSASDPTTIRGACTFHYTPDDPTTGYVGFTMKVRKGDYWKVVPSGTGTVNTFSVYWIPAEG